jgi:Mn-dependent DtxR family transcriptional regulator
MDGQSIFLTDLASKLQVSQLRVGKALENLETTGFVAPEYNAVYGTKAALTRRGRDYILANEFGR